MIISELRNGIDGNDTDEIINFCIQELCLIHKLLSANGEAGLAKVRMLDVGKNIGSPAFLVGANLRINRPTLQV